MPAEVVPTVAAAAPPTRKWKTKRVKNVAEVTEVLAPAPASKAPAAPTLGVAVLAAPAPAQKLTMGRILNSVIEVVESSGTFVDPTPLSEAHLRLIHAGTKNISRHEGIL
jgi:hypothetical protein